MKFWVNVFDSKIPTIAVITHKLLWSI